MATQIILLSWRLTWLLESVVILFTEKNTNSLVSVNLKIWLEFPGFDLKKKHFHPCFLCVQKINKF